MTVWGRRILPVLAAVLLVAALGGWLPTGSGGPGPAATTQRPAETTASATRASPARSDSTIPTGSGFDFYVLSLSWSPSYCAAEGKDANPQQCAAARPYAFVVHGLWPQFERGFPQDCPSDRPKVDDKTLRGLYDIMPSAGLIRHEWKTHGACAGLDQRDYFRVLRAAREKVVIPAQFRQLDRYRQLAPGEVEAAFLRANAELPAGAVAVTCDRRYLREVRVCMTRDLRFRSCPEIDRRACRSREVVMPPVRGG
jgi:ribonuclease T2